MILKTLKILKILIFIASTMIVQDLIMVQILQFYHFHPPQILHIILNSDLSSQFDEGLTILFNLFKEPNLTLNSYQLDQVMIKVQILQFLLLNLLLKLAYENHI